MAGPALFRAGPFLICFYGGYDGNTSVGDTAAKTVGYAAVGCENREFSGIFGRITCRSGYALSADVEYILRLVRSILCFSAAWKFRILIFRLRLSEEQSPPQEGIDVSSCMLRKRTVRKRSGFLTGRCLLFPLFFRSSAKQWRQIGS